MAITEKILLLIIAASFSAFIIDYTFFKLMTREE